MPNSWSKQAYVQGFDYKYISLKKYVNMFEQIDISGFIYEGVLEPSYTKKLPCQIPTVLVTAEIREDNPSCHRPTL